MLTNQFSIVIFDPLHQYINRPNKVSISYWNFILSFEQIWKNHLKTCRLRLLSVYRANFQLPHLSKPCYVRNVTDGVTGPAGLAYVGHTIVRLWRKKWTLIGNARPVQLNSTQQNSNKALPTMISIFQNYYFRLLLNEHQMGAKFNYRILQNNLLPCPLFMPM